MWFTRLAIARPILIWMAIAAVTVLGFQSFRRLPAELNPRVDIPTLTVTTTYVGAGPPEVEQQISKPLEEAVGAAPGVRGVFSSSQANVSIIVIDFKVGTNLDSAAADVRSRIDSLQTPLPAGAARPVVAKLDINALPILSYGVASASASPTALNTLLEKTLKPRIERVPGVASVQLIGGTKGEARVDVDADELRALNITIGDVAASLAAAGRNISGGSIIFGQKETNVRLTSAFETLHAIRDVQIVSPTLAPAAPPAAVAPSGLYNQPLPPPPVTVGDVAAVSQGPAESNELLRVNGRPGISLAINRAPDANTVLVADGVKEAIARAQAALPKDIRFVTLRDDSVLVHDALQDVNGSLILGSLLAMTVILLFLHNLRGTLIVSLAIPTCIVATFIVMWAAKFSLNQMTLLALSLSVGILVDDSIVVLESITRHRSYGETPKEAALNGRGEIGFADITTTMVDVVVFAPVAFMGGIVGGFFREFGLTIVAATLFSLVVSFSITPMLAARWYRRGEATVATRGLFGGIERVMQRLEGSYRRLIALALARRLFVVVVGVSAVAAVVLVCAGRLGFEFIPGVDQGQITISLEMPAGSSLASTDAAARKIESLVLHDTQVAATTTTVGRSVGGFGSTPQQGQQFAQVALRLRDKAGLLDRLLGHAPGMRQVSDDTISNAIRRDLAALSPPLPGSVSVAAVRNVLGSTSAIVIDLEGADVNQIAAFGATVQNLLRHTPGVLDPAISVRTGKPEVRAEIDRRRAAELGVAPDAAGAVLRTAVAGSTDSLLRYGGEERVIRVRQAGLNRDNPAAIGSVTVGYTPDLRPIALADIANIGERSGPANIERTNGKRVATVSANLAANTPLGNARQSIDRQLAVIPHPGITIHWGGEAETLDENAIFFAEALILGSILVYLVMASLFNSIGIPLVIMCALPMALAGALAALVLTGETMSLVAGIGIVMLIGLMGRNAILLLDYTRTLIARGMDRREAIIEAGAVRLRPILMTTTATIVGMLPVALRIGRASEARAPMAVVVIGGLLVSTVLTLVMVPVLYSLFEDAVSLMRGRAPRPAERPGE